MIWSAVAHILSVPFELIHINQLNYFVAGAKDSLIYVYSDGDLPAKAYCPKCEEPIFRNCHCERFSALIVCEKAGLANWSVLYWPSHLLESRLIRSEVYIRMAWFVIAIVSRHYWNSLISAG